MRSMSSSKEPFGSLKWFGFDFKISNSKAWSQPLRAMRKVCHKLDKAGRAILQTEILNFRFKIKCSKA